MFDGLISVAMCLPWIDCIVNSVYSITWVLCVNDVLFSGLCMGILMALLDITMLVIMCYILHIILFIDVSVDKYVYLLMASLISFWGAVSFYGV